MKVWIFNPYGNLPGEGWSPYRSTSIANALTARGHEVVWWVSNFEHRSKRVRSASDTRVDFGGGYFARILPARTYQRHISIDRIRYERSYAHALHAAVLAEPTRPDIIIHGEPAICLSDISLKVIGLCGVPWVIDVIDIWPELFALLLPRSIRPLQSVIFAPLYARRRRFFRRTDGFLAVARNYLSLAQKIAPGTPGEVVYLGTDTSAFSRACDPLPPTLTLVLPEKRLGEFWCIYVGTLGKNYDVATLLDCATRLQGSNIRILVAGDGDLRPQVEAAAAGPCRDVLTYLGRLSFSDLCLLYPRCDIALACYASASTVSMPFKAFDYLAAGLPIVTSLAGDLGDFVASRRIGLSYRAEDADSLLSAIRSLATDSSLRSTAKDRAIELGRSMDYSVQYSRAADFIEQIAAIPAAMRDRGIRHVS